MLHYLKEHSWLKSADENYPATAALQDLCEETCFTIHTSNLRVSMNNFYCSGAGLYSQLISMLCVRILLYTQEFISHCHSSISERINNTL